MKLFILLIFLWSTMLLSCDPRPIRNNRIPLKNLEIETFSKVDTTHKHSVDGIKEE